jgi:hypothetical protein
MFNDSISNAAVELDLMRWEVKEYVVGKSWPHILWTCVSAS